MIRIGGVFNDIASMDVLDEAAKKACSSRKNIIEVQDFLVRRDELLLRLREQLLDGTFVSSRYRMFTVKERGKERFVADLPLYPDRILHWAICIVVEERLNRKLIDQSYGSRKGMGYHDAVKRVYDYLQDDSRLRYALVVDVKKFFASIDKDILKRKLERAFKDRRFLDLMFGLIDDYPYSGIPIGNRYSPMLANLYLSEMDHTLKEKYHVHYLVAFMDDRCILGYSKKWLRSILHVMERMLADIGLELKPNYQIFPIDSRGIPFLGYRIFTDHILLNKQTKKRMQRAAARISGRLEDPDYRLDNHDRGTIYSYHGVLQWCNGRHLHSLTLTPLIDADIRQRALSEMNR